MTIVVTRNVPDRYRGFLASCMLELAPGVYASPDMSRAVRDRVWAVCCEWSVVLPKDGGVLMTYRDHESPSGLAVLTLGWTKKELVELDGIWVDHAAPGSLKTE
jgi:CRISPR-associated protein Cas2